MKWMARILVIASVVAGVQQGAMAETLLSADFDQGVDGFSYCDNPFLGTTLAGYGAGTHAATDGYQGSGGVLTTLGGPGKSQTVGASGGWCIGLDLAAPAQDVAISLRYSMQLDKRNRYDEFSRLLVSIDGNLLGRGDKSYVDHLGGSSGVPGDVDPATDWQQVVIRVGNLTAGTHRLQIGAYNNKTAQVGAATLLWLDDVVVTSNSAPAAADAAHILVGRLDLDQFKANIASVASFGDRSSGTTKFKLAQDWVTQRLQSFGYQVQTQTTMDGSLPVTNTYVTKVGRLRPDQMYIVSAHLDGRGGGEAADDDGSGVSLVLEVARLLAAPDIETDISVRMILWDDEEWGSVGSRSYVTQRKSLRGIENPPGSGLYPEPDWLGILQHDMLLYDHGLQPAGAAQSPYADLDVEWNHFATMAARSRSLALAWHHLDGEYASNYPSTAYNNSSSTDDLAFEQLTAAVSVRENRRKLDFDEWANPNWHQATDLYSAYLPEDFLLGFNAVQTTLGLVATLAGAHVQVDGIFTDGFDAGGERAAHAPAKAVSRGRPRGRH